MRMRALVYGVVPNSGDADGRETPLVRLRFLLAARHVATTYSTAGARRRMF